MEWAQDCNNVIISGAGFLEKLRRSITKSTPNAVLGAIDTMFDFQQAIGTRQLFVNQGNNLGYFTEPVIGNPFVFTLVEANPLDSPRFSFIDSNNLLFMANGRRMLKWTGTVLRNWGIAPPATPVAFGIKVNVVSVQRAANVVTCTFGPFTNPNAQVGDQISFVEPSDHSFDGIFALTAANPLTGVYQWAQVAGNAGPFADGIITLPSDHEAANLLAGTGVVRKNGVSTVTLAAGQKFAASPTQRITIAGNSEATVNGTWVIRNTFGVTGNVFDFLQDLPDATGGGGTVVNAAGGFTLLGGVSWRITFKSSVTGEESVASGASPVVMVGAGRSTYIIIPDYLYDPQIDTVCVFRSYDGGADWNLWKEIPLPLPNLGPLFPNSLNVILDYSTDDDLDPTQRANFINFPPLVGTRLSKWQGRIYLVPNSNPQSIIYSGYEKILRGRPESSFPPGNQIQMQVGAASIKGHGPLMNGVVIWDDNDKMFMFKGTVEDIVTNQPVNYSEQLEEMPWQTGVTSHQSIQPTPKGLVWFGSDYAIHKWNGIYYGEVIGPVDLTVNISPLLRRITAGTAPNIQAEYFNFLERDWYVALICVDGSVYYNRILFLDMSDSADDNVGIFVSDIQADSIAVRVDANEIRHLLITYQGIVYEIKSASTATAGIHKTITSTPNNLNAFWLSGYDGNDDAITMKMYRWGRLITDQDGFNLLVTLVNDADSTLAEPTIMKAFPNIKRNLNKFSVNWKAKRMAVQINFPDADVDASVLQLITTHIPLSER